MIQRIYQHATEEGWLVPGSTVLDPFSGTGLGGLDAGLGGYRFLGVELEPRFHALATGFDCGGDIDKHAACSQQDEHGPHHVLGNLELWQRKYGGLPQWVAPRVLQGDSRYLAEVLRKEGCKDAGIYADLPTGPCLVPLMPEHDRDLASRLLAKVLQTERCWEWQGQKHPKGYGTLLKAGKKLLTHRASWIIHYGAIPNELRVLHRCDNPPCVRPDHLFLGTNGDNWRDACTKRRAWMYTTPEKQPRGEAHGRAKLTAKQVQEIRTTYRHGIHGYRRLAKEYEVSRPVIKGIVHGTAWTHLPCGNLPPGSLDVAVSSPSYGGNEKCDYRITDTRGLDRDERRGKRQGKGSFRGSETYGQSEGQLGAMITGDVQAVVSSPPYAGSQQVDNRTTIPSALSSTWAKRFGTISDGTDQRQLANADTNTFWSAARTILEETYAVLKPGGAAIWVLKSYCRAGKIVDFPGQWQALCEHVGFVTLHEHHTMLVKEHGAQENLFSDDGPDMHYTDAEGDNFLLPLRTTGRYTPTQYTEKLQTKKISFFRRLHEQKRPDLAIDYEVVLCMRKPLSPAPMPPDEAWCQMPLVDGCVSSPPYADGCIHDTGQDATTVRHGSGTLSKPWGTRRDGNSLGEYGATQGQLGAMPRGHLDLALSSPPYCDNPAAACEGNMSGKPGGRKASALTTVNGNIKAEGYGTTDGQLGAMAPGSLDAVVSSPPWLDQEPSHAQHDTPSTRWLRAEPARVRGQRFLASTYGETPGQLGAMPSGTPPTEEDV